MQDSLQDVKSEYGAYEDFLFGKIKGLCRFNRFLNKHWCLSFIFV